MGLNTTLRLPRSLLVGFVIGLLLVTSSPASVDAATRERIFGASRYETAVEISRTSFPDQADVVYLARGDVFADALAAGTLTDGPVLLVPRCDSIPPHVRDRIAELDPAEVIALGGTGAICDRTLDELANGRQKGRISGNSRYETAVAISQRAFPDGAATAYLANGNDSPDAVAGGALTGGPILLVPPGDGEVPLAVLQEVKRLGVERVIALGGRAVVSNAKLSAASLGAKTTRLSGSDRYETAAAIGKHQFPVSVPLTSVYLARGDVFADAVAAGSLTDGPILLVPSCGAVPADVVAYLEASRPQRVVALGGPGAVCDQLLDAASLYTSDTEFLHLDVDGNQLRLDATQPYVLVTDVPVGHTSLVFHDYSRGYEGSVKVEVFDATNERVFSSSLKDSSARAFPIHDAPGRYITRLTPRDVETGAKIRVDATRWEELPLKPDVGTHEHVGTRFGHGLVIPVEVVDPKPWQWMSSTVVDNLVHVYSGRASIGVQYPDGQVFDVADKSFKTDLDVSLRWATPVAGTYKVLIDPKENLMETTVSVDTWQVGTTTPGSARFSLLPDRYGDGGTWRFGVNERTWFSVVGEEQDAESSCVFEIALLDDNNEEIAKKRCTKNFAHIPMEAPYTGNYAALAHTFDTTEIKLEVTPWKIDTITVDGPGATVTPPAGKRGVGGVIRFNAENSDLIDVVVDYPGAATRPTVKLERTSGVYLRPLDSDASSSQWTGQFSMPESGEYRVLVDTRGYATEFTVSAETSS